MKQMVSNYDLQVDIGRRIFLEYEQQQIIQKFALAADDQWIYLTYLNSPCRISRAEGRIETLDQGEWIECRNFNTVMSIYDLLCYHQGAHAPILSGQWCTAGNFIITGIQDSTASTKKYAALFDGRVKELMAACERLGGILQPRMAGADVVCQIPVTPFFPVLLQFWAGDEDFPPKLMLLWDRNADSFLHFETTFYVQGDILERLRKAWDPNDRV